jgi:hypothetical protein
MSKIRKFTSRIDMSQASKLSRSENMSSPESKSIQNSHKTSEEIDIREIRRSNIML